ncbi:MAG: putative lipoprotein, partial [Myxococcaceae bacterium]|nr:putative lipoprotein [Myxococcaceae bacterium]
ELPATLDFGAVNRGDTFDLVTKLKNTRPIAAVAFVGDVTSNSGDDKAFTFRPNSPTGEVSLAAGAEKAVTLTFAPTEVKDYLARVTMRRLDGCPDRIVKLIGTGVDAVLTWGPNPLDLGYVTPGLQVSGEVTFSNLGLKPVSLAGLSTSTADYKVVTAQPVEIPAAIRDAAGMLQPGAAKVAVSFKPTLLGPRNARLDFTTSLPKQSSGTELLKGYGGGPDIDVKPSTLNVGRVAYFAGSASHATRKLTIQNVGTRPTPADPKANLHLGAGAAYWEVRVKAGVAGNTAALGELCVGEVRADGTCTHLPLAGSYDPAIGLEASGIKALLDVPVRVTPATLGPKDWEVVIFSDDPDEPAFTVPIHAEAIALTPCDYEVSPLNLNFGLVSPPDYKDLSFTIRNKGQNPSDLCLISNLDLKAPTNVVFSLPAGALFDQELQPGATLTVPVRAWPQGAVPAAVTSATGLVSFNISNPAKPEGVVSLNATIAASCLTLSPDDLDFGTVQKDCSSATRTFTIYNTCSAPVRINSYTMVSPAGEKAGSANCPGTADCAEFHPVSTAGIAPNTDLNPGASPVTFSLKYRPINYGPDNGAFLIKVTQNGSVVDYIVTLNGNGDALGLNVDIHKQDNKPKADILVVIDNSCSMFDKQTALSVNFGSFIKYAIAAQVDYQIGVITTDDGDGGKLIGDAANPKVLKPTTPDVENRFKSKVVQGTSGSGNEMSLLPSVMALTAPVITVENAGLLRSDAVLAVVSVSDADDQSPLPVSYYVNQLLNIKGAQQASKFTFNAVAPLLAAAPAGCTYDSTGPRTQTAVNATAGVLEEICTADWGKTLEKIGQRAFGYRTNFHLTSSPDLTAGKTVVVKIDGVTLDPVDSRGAQVWTYDSTDNSVNFEPLFVPEPGKTLTLTYFVACIP